jgi:hypothetical protein
MKSVNTKRGTVALAIAAALTLSACEYIPVPIETVRPVTNQLDMQAIYHWDRLAERVAANIRDNLAVQNTRFIPEPIVVDSVFIAPVAIGDDTLSNLPAGTLPPPGPIPENRSALSDEPQVIELDLSAPDLGLNAQEAEQINFSTQSAIQLAAPNKPSERPVLYINPPRGGYETKFGHSFHKLLRSHLTQKGIAVSTRPDTVSTYCTTGRFCKPMILTYDIDLVNHKDRWHVLEPESEVLINTSVTDGDLVVFSRSDMYYINSGDGDHYQRGTKTLKVVDR